MYPPALSSKLARLLALSLLGLGGCGGSSYRVEVGLPAGVAGEQVLVRVVESCGSNTVLTQSVVTRGQAGMVLGSLPRGSYGVEALVFDASCDLVAEGCVMVDATGAGGLIQVETSTSDLRSCRRAEDCMCTLPAPDAGPPDAGPDAPCTDCNDDGRCENLMTSRDHCGRCDNRCATGERCADGVCE